MRDVTRIRPRFVERVWGRTDLAPLWGKQDRKIGEVWFELPDDYPLLVKFIFTEERLSIQVHPDDDYARQHEGSRGKTEMWYILSAEPGATVALGFREAVTADQVRRSIADGTIEQLLNMMPVKPGDALHTQCRTIHAIGAGVALCEIQQNSDVTYRLYDYGRQRELHVEKGLEVLNLEPYDGRRELPVRSEYYTTELLDTEADTSSFDEHREHLLICLSGSGRVSEEQYQPGEVFRISAGQELLPMHPAAPSHFLRTRP
ncbi:MAG TPA: class I mannose-6-phosphate isomerase [Bryobacteraceae bacterium]|nr:class I mannose-6-phosphate isomerase [Bryobacteraceae bacterium]